MGLIAARADVVAGAALVIARWVRQGDDADEIAPRSGRDLPILRSYLPDLERLAGGGDRGRPGLLILSVFLRLDGAARDRVVLLDIQPPKSGWILEEVDPSALIERRWFATKQAAQAALLLRCWEVGGLPDPKATSADLQYMSGRTGSWAAVWPCDKRGFKRIKNNSTAGRLRAPNLRPKRARGKEKSDGTHGRA